MRYGAAAAFRQALDQGLLARAAPGIASASAFDRLLARLEEVAPGAWRLKGGFALDVRLADRARATRDVDIDRRADEEELAETLIESFGVSGDDFFNEPVREGARRHLRSSGPDGDNGGDAGGSLRSVRAADHSLIAAAALGDARPLVVEDLDQLNR